MSSSGSSVQTGHQARGGHRPPPKRAALIDHDAFETEAEAVAERVVSMPVAPRDSDGSGDRPDRHPSEWPSGRRPLPRAQQFGHGEGARRSQASAHTFSATAGCGEPALQTNLSEFRTAHPRPIDRPTLPGGPPARTERPSVRVTSLPWTELGSGEPIAAPWRAWFEARFDYDFSSVRIHRGSAAASLAEHYSARAFTYGSHIVLGADAPGADTLDGRRLLAHELAHTVQQASPLARGELSPQARPRGPPATARRLSVSQRTVGLGVQCDTFDDVTGAVVDFGVGAYHGARDLGGAAIDLASEGFETVVDYFAPGLLAFVRGGYVGQLTDLFCSGIDSLVGSLISPLADIDIVSTIEQTFNSLTDGVNGVKNAIGSAASTAIGSLMRPVVEAIQVYGDPILQGITSVADTIESIFSGLWDNIAVPVLDFLGTVGGAIWSAFNDLITWIEDITAPLRAAAEWAWNELCEEFDLAWNATGGIRKWFSDTAQDIWDSFQETIEPIKTPLMVVGGILLLLSPFGPVIIVTQVIPPLYDKLVWLWNNWNTDDILVQAREILAHDILPAIIGTVSTVSAAIAGAVSWLAGITVSVSEAFGDVLGVFGVNHCLAAVTRVLNHVSDQFKRLADWAKGGFKGLGEAVTAVFNAIVAIFEPILDFLVRLLIAATNPPMIPVMLAATIWLLCPDELKPPVIDFVIDLLIQFVRIFSAFMVSLWPLNAFMKEAAIGFLEELRGNGTSDTARKIAVTNKIANLLAGGGLRFAAGFVVGLLEGLLDGVLDPFRIIIMIVQLVAGICRALGNIIGPLIARMSPAAGGVINDYRTSLDAAPFPTGDAAAGAAAAAPATASSGLVAGAAVAPAAAPASGGATTTEAAPATGPPPEIAAEIERYRAAAEASAQYAPPTPRRAYSHRTVPVPPTVAAPPAPTATSEGATVASTPGTAPDAADASAGSPATSTDVSAGAPAPASGAQAALMQDETLASLVGPGPLPSNEDVVAALTPDMAGELTQSGSELSSAAEGGEGEVAGEMNATGGSPRALSQVLGDLWDTALTGAANLGARIARALMEFIMQPDYALGRKIGWVAGFVLFQVILAYFTAGISAEAEACSPILKAIVRFLDLGGEILGLIGKAAGRVAPMVMRFLGPVGRFLGRFRFLDRIMGVISRAVRGLARFGERAAGAVVRTARRVTDPLGAAAMHAVGFKPSAIARVMGGAERHLAGEAATSALARDTTGAAGHATTAPLSREANAAAHAEGSAVGGTGGVVDDASRAARETADPAAHGAGSEVDDVAAREAREAEDAARRGEAREADEAADLARRKEAEMPLAMAEMALFCETNDAVNTPKAVLIAGLYALFGERYPWIKRFYARDLPIPHHYRILFEASPPHEIDGDYSDDETSAPAPATTTATPDAPPPARTSGRPDLTEIPPGTQITHLPPGPRPPPQVIEVGGRRTTAGIDIEDDIAEGLLRDVRTPGGAPMPRAAEIGNFAHEYAEELPRFAEEILPPGTLPSGLEREYEIVMPNGDVLRADRVDVVNGIVYEIKPNTGNWPQRGAVQAQTYARRLDQLEPLGGGRRWRTQVITYDMEALERWLVRRGYLEPVPGRFERELLGEFGERSGARTTGSPNPFTSEDLSPISTGSLADPAERARLGMTGDGPRYNVDRELAADYPELFTPRGRPRARRWATGPAPAATPSVVHSALSSPGRPLDPPTRATFEPRLGVSLANVRVHTGATAASAASSINARAYAAGSHLVFGRGQYAPHTTTGRTLLAHELAHVAQQSRTPAAGAAVDAADSRAEREAHAFAAGAAPAPVSSATPCIRREPTVADPADEDIKVEDVPDEKPKYSWINYDDAIRKNRLWFEMFELANVNPFYPWDPFAYPIAFTNHVASWQISAKHAKIAEVVFAAENPGTQNSAAGIADAVADADQKIAAGKLKAAKPINADGVLGGRTFWLMLAAAALSKDEKNREILIKQGLDVSVLEPLTHDESDEWGRAWRAVHAYVFNPPHFRATWSIVIGSDIVFTTFEKMVALGEANRAFLESLFFPEGVPADAEIEEEDYIAIMARGYVGQALEGVVSLFEVDRPYFHDVDVQRLLQTTRPDWKNHVDLRMGFADWESAQTLVEDFGLEVPGDKKAQSTYEKLQQQSSPGAGLISQPDTSRAVLAVVFNLPDHDADFWQETAKNYVAEKKALAEAADKATQEHLAELKQKFDERMAGAPDITKDDAMAFLELLVGDTFTSAQNDALAFQQKDAAKNDVDIIGKRQDSTSANKAATLRDRAEKEGFLVVQLGEKAESRFPLPFLQIERSRANAGINGKRPLAFDVIDTPHAAMHSYLPRRFTARPSDDGGSEAASNPYELTWDSSIPGGGSGNAWENWAYFTPRQFGTLDPVLVEIRQFNPDAGQLVRLGRQIGGTDKIVLQYVWTLGTSLPELNKNLWSAQGKVNLVGWIDAGLTLLALGSLVAAPMAAATEASGSVAAAELGQAAINAAVRKALVQALKRFIIQEAIGEGLGRITYYVNDSPDVPDWLKKAWNGLMIALLIYGLSKTVRAGFKSLRNSPTAKFNAELAALEASLEAEVKPGATKVNATAEAAAEADIKQKTKQEFDAAVGEHAGPDTGPGRVRTDDPRAEAAVKADAPPDPGAANTKLGSILGEDATKALAEKLKPGTLGRLAALGDESLIRKLVESLSPEMLERVLATVAPETLLKLAQKAEGAVLKTLLEAFAGSTGGVDLLRAFAGDPTRLAALLEKIGAKRLLAISGNPGADKFFRFASRVDPAAIADALKNIAAKADTQLSRFRQLITDLGPEGAADVLNTYTGAEIKSRWKPKEGMSAAQNLGRLAIQRGAPTKARLASGIPITPTPGRTAHLLAADFRPFFAIGPEATLPSTIRRLVAMVQEASAKAANHLNELIERAAAGKLTDADLQALPPNARATVEAFLKAGAEDGNRHALYGSALQYMAEGELRAQFGGQLPPGVALRRTEVRYGKTLIPDAQLELTMSKDLRYPQTNTTERAVVDWTTAGEAGKITKYRGGKPPVTYAVEIIQPGPPPVPEPPPKVLPPIIPSMPDAPPDTTTDPNPKKQ